MAIDPKWKKTIDDGLKHPLRSAHVPVISSEVESYNRRMAETEGYSCVDWPVVEAIVWIESGGPAGKNQGRAWNSRAMQIGNPGDPGLRALKNEEGPARLVVDDLLLSRIKVATNDALSEPAFNIKTGIAYLFVRMAQSNIESITTGTTPKEYIIKPGDYLSKIATHLNTTVEAIEFETLKEDPNFSKNSLKQGQRIYYREANRGRVITGWRSFNSNNIADAYNGGGDSDYAAKHQYVLDRL